MLCRTIEISSGPGHSSSSFHPPVKKQPWFQWKALPNQLWWHMSSQAARAWSQVWVPIEHFCENPISPHTCVSRLLLGAEKLGRSPSTGVVHILFHFFQEGQSPSFPPRQSSSMPNLDFNSWTCFKVQENSREILQCQ